MPLSLILPYGAESVRIQLLSLTQQKIFITPKTFDYVHNNLQKYKQLMNLHYIRLHFQRAVTLHINY